MAAPGGILRRRVLAASTGASLCLPRRWVLIDGRSGPIADHGRRGKQTFNVEAQGRAADRRSAPWSAV